MIKTISRIAVIALFAVASVSIAAQAHAQAATAPVLYDQSGNVVSGYNASTGMLNEGYYYNQSGQQLYYYPNGTYYNPTTGLYGGSAYYGTTIPAGYVAPGVPNTGAGGNAAFNWLALVASGLVAVGAAAYVATNRKAFQ